MMPLHKNVLDQIQQHANTSCYSTNLNTLIAIN